MPADSVGLLPDDFGSIGPGGGELVKLEQKASKIGRFFYQSDFIATVGKCKGRGHTGDPAAYNHRPGVHRGLDRFLRLEQSSFGDTHPNEVPGLAGASFPLLHVDPRALVANVHHLEEVRVQSTLGASPTEKRLVSARSAGCDHYPVQVLLFDCGLDFVYAALRAGVKVFLYEGNIGQGSRVLGQRLDVKIAGDVAATVANKNSYSDFFCQLSTSSGIAPHLARSWTAGEC